MSSATVPRRDRHGAILQLIRAHRVGSQGELKELLAGEGIEVTQATLSRDLRDLRLVKAPGADGLSHYTLPEEWEQTPPLESLIPIILRAPEPMEEVRRRLLAIAEGNRTTP